jgi:RNase P/RNase MRP subunit POP5
MRRQCEAVEREAARVRLTHHREQCVLAAQRQHHDEFLAAQLLVRVQVQQQRLAVGRPTGACGLEFAGR